MANSLEDLPEEAQERIREIAEALKVHREAVVPFLAPGAFDLLDFQGVLLLKALMRIESLEAADGFKPVAPISEEISADEARYLMINELAVALHGEEMCARPITPKEVWEELLTEVRELVHRMESLDK